MVTAESLLQSRFVIDMVSLDSISFTWLASYDTQNCCPNQTDSQTKVKLVSNWYEPKINNLQRQSEKD